MQEPSEKQPANFSFEDYLITCDKRYFGDCGHIQAIKSKAGKKLTSQEGQEIINALAKIIYNFFTATENTAPNSIARLISNEHYFYTSAPLSLAQFEDIMTMLSANLFTSRELHQQLILGSFAVLEPDTQRVMNVTPVIQCGESPTFQLIVKNNPVDNEHMGEVLMPDPTYVQTNGKPFLNLGVTDIAEEDLPSINIEGTACKFTFNNLVPSQNRAGQEYITAVDICLDHEKAVAKNRLMAKMAIMSQQERNNLQVSHVIVSDVIHRKLRNSIGTPVQACTSIIPEGMRAYGCFGGGESDQQRIKSLGEYGDAKTVTMKANTHTCLTMEQIISKSPEYWQDLNIETAQAAEDSSYRECKSGFFYHSTGRDVIDNAKEASASKSASFSS
jgi:hypothetical protein